MVLIFVVIVFLPWLVFTGFTMFCRDVEFRRWLERGRRDKNFMGLLHIFLFLLGVLIAGGIWVVLALLDYLGRI